MSDLVRRDGQALTRSENIGTMAPWWGWAAGGVAAAYLLPFWLLVIAAVGAGVFIFKPR